MSQNASKLRLEDLEIKPHLITKLKGAGIESIFDLAISTPHQLIEDGGILTVADTQIAVDLVMKAKKALIDSGLLAKDFSTADGCYISTFKFQFFVQGSSRHFLHHPCYFHIHHV
jgi:hypothetical protein